VALNWTRFFGSAGSNAAGFAIGVTAAPALRPAVQYLENEAWKLHPDRPPDAVILAQGVAQGQVDPASAAEWAAEQGISGDAFAALVNVANVGPPLGLAYEAWRRGLLTDAEFTTALKRTGLEGRWDAALRGLHDVLLTSPELAMAQQQGFVDEARSNAEAHLQGVTNERQQIRFAMAGLPPGVETALAMLRRGIIGEAEFARIVREGHTKTKYTGVLQQLQRQLLSAATAVRAHLKGHISEAEMHSRGADWGYTPADMDLWYQAEGRPATTHQIHIGYERGATLPGASGELDAIATAVRQSDIRPEYTDLLQAARFTLPTPFVMRALTESGVWSQQKAATRLKQAGWIHQDADEAAAAWAGGGGGSGADPNVKKAQTKAWGEAQSSYIARESTAADVAPIFQLLGIGAADQAEILTAWDAVRDLTRRQLSPAQIVKAIKVGTRNPATGQPWTKADGLAALLARGYDQADADTLLNE
jgi:hypothetical protein